MRESLSREIDHVLSSLPQRDAEIIKLAFGLHGGGEMTLEEIGLKFGLTRERVRQIKEKGVRSLRHGTNCEALKQYL